MMPDKHDTKAQKSTNNRYGYSKQEAQKRKDHKRAPTGNRSGYSSVLVATIAVNHVNFRAQGGAADVPATAKVLVP